MKAKIVVSFFLFFILFSAVVVKAFYIQVLKRDKLIAYSESQMIRKTKIYPKRGFILDRNDNPLAINIQKYNLFTFAKDNQQLKKDLYALDKYLPSIEVRKILKSAKSRKRFTWIARDIELNDSQVEKIKKLKTVALESRSSRFYPNHELLAQTLGFVGIDNDGLAGIEYEFNERLKGEPVIHKYFKDAKGRPVKFKSANFDKRAEDITLSIDKDIQANLEEYLKEGVIESEGLSGGAAVMDVSTGEILAIANYPAYDPNIKRGSKNQKLSFATDPFEPGSVFKSLTIAAAIEQKIVKPDTNYYCERGRFKVGNHIIKESDSNHVFEWLSVTEILQNSSNIGTTKIAFDLTYPNLIEMLKKFNIGNKTGIQIPGESRGIMDDKENVSPLRLSNMSFGQGVATTGVQMMASYAAFANGGYYVKPTLLKVTKEEQVNSKRILSKSTSKALTKMLVSAVEEGTGGNAKVKRFQIAGKTSTAQRADSSGGYTGYVAGFIGYPVNVDKPFVVYVYVDNPQNGYYGNSIAAPIFQKITRSILYKTKNIQRLELPSTNESFHNSDSLNIQLSAQRKVQKGIMPNLIGLDKISAFHLLEKAGLDYSVKGFGVVNKQFPQAGSEITENVKVELNFSPPHYD